MEFLATSHRVQLNCFPLLCVFHLCFHLRIKLIYINSHCKCSVFHGVKWDLYTHLITQIHLILFSPHILQQRGSDGAALMDSWQPHCPAKINTASLSHFLICYCTDISSSMCMRKENVSWCIRQSRSSGGLHQCSCAQGYRNGRAHNVKGDYDKGDAFLPCCHVARLKHEGNGM